MSIYDSTTSVPIVVNFNSKDRISGSNSNFTSEAIDIGINKYDSVCVVQASIPKSFYNMPTGYNTFTLTEGVRGSTTITVTPGSYNKNNLLTTIQTLLNAGSITINPVGNFTYTVTYPAYTSVDTYKFTFTVTGNGVIQPSFTFQTTTSPFRQLGFNENTVNTFVTSSLTSTNALNLQFILRAFIKSNICKNAQDGILEEFLNLGSYPNLGVVYFQQVNYDMNTREYNSSFTNSWNFSLVDAFDQLIDLNGIPWAFSLVFYQRNNTHELHKTDLQIKNEERLFSIENAQRNLQKNLFGKNETTGNVDSSRNILPESLNNVDNISISQIKPLFPVLPFSVGIINNIPKIQNPK